MNFNKVALIGLVALIPVTSNAANWAGPYVGVVASAGQPTTIVDDYDCYITCTSWNENSKMGFTYGLDGGYNWTLSPAVLVGVEADFSGTNFKGSAYSAQWGGTGAGHNSKWSSITTLRARAGVVMDNAVLYATGGLAGVDLKATGFYNPAPGHNYDDSGYRIGLAGGVGFEYKFAKAWSFKGEYIHVSTPGKTVLATGATNDYDQYKVTASADLFRFGVNYLF